MSQFAELITEPQVEDPIRFVVDTFLPTVWQPKREDMVFAGEAQPIPYTPPALIAEINDKIDPIRNRCLSTRICVLYTIEWAILLEAMGFTNITLVTQTLDPLLATQAIKYNYNYKVLEDITDMKFDVVVGNPPFQATMQDGSRKSKNSNLWSEFLKLTANELTKDNGYFALITPPSWLSPNSKVQHLLFDRQILALNVNECKRHFTVGSAFSYYVVENTPPYKSTEVVSEYKRRVYDATVMIQDFPYLPGWITDETISILQKTIFADNAKLDVRNTCEIHTSRRTGALSDEQTETHYQPTFYTTGKIKFANKRSSNTDMNKVLFNEPGYIRPVYDPGQLASASSAMYIPVENEMEGQRIVDTLSSKLYQFITTISRWNGFNIQRVLKKLPATGDHPITDEDLYTFFGLTTEEITLIEENVR